jgi:hypothetical protein
MAKPGRNQWPAVIRRGEKKRIEAYSGVAAGRGGSPIGRN